MKDSSEDDIKIDAMNLLIYIICQPCWSSLILSEAVQLLKDMAASQLKQEGVVEEEELPESPYEEENFMEIGKRVVNRKNPKVKKMVPGAENVMDFFRKKHEVPTASINLALFDILDG